MRTDPPVIGVPLRLRPTYDEKPWGGRKLEELGKPLPEGLIGESLETGRESTVEGGPFDAISLGELERRHPVALLGTRGVEAARQFNDVPLLVKLIDARQDLSVQVHPSDANAPEGKRGKTEAWVILDSDDEGSLITGIDGPLNEGRIGDRIVREAVCPGDVFVVPAGTVHAIGAGVVLYEIQQASDVTYRLYDWGRPREMHLEEGLAVANPASRATRVRPLRLDDTREVLVACAHFALERWTVDREIDIDLVGDDQSCRVMTVVDGAVSVGDHRIDCGSSMLLPADLNSTVLRSVDSSATLLVGFIPDLSSDVIQPLIAAGHDQDAIRQLGIEVR